jgi:hypothetical protein
VVCGTEESGHNSTVPPSSSQTMGGQAKLHARFSKTAVKLPLRIYDAGTDRQHRKRAEIDPDYPCDCDIAYFSCWTANKIARNCSITQCVC